MTSAELAVYSNGLNVLLEERAEVFHNADGETFIRVAVDSHWENYPLKLKGPFRRWCNFTFYTAFNFALPDKVFKTVLENLQAMAEFDASEFRTPMRIAEHNGNTYLDLCDAEWRCVEITANGWKVISDPPVRFLRTAGMRALPVPVSGGKIQDLFNFINVKGHDQQILALAWLLGAFHAEGPYPLLVLQGTQGGAKTSTQHILRRMIDPAESLSGGPPTEKELRVASKQSHVLAFNNLSNLTDKLSDSLCRKSTEGDDIARELYTTADPVFFNRCHPISINGIENVITKSDLLSRAIVLHFTKIQEKDIKDRGPLLSEFEAAQPKLLGTMCDAVSAALRNKNATVLTEKSRMADFCTWVAAGCAPLGFTAQEFLAAYTRNRFESHFVALEGSPAATVKTLISSLGEWVGILADLLTAMNRCVPKDLQGPDWPKSPRHLSAILSRSEVNLAAAGITIKKLNRKGGTGDRLYHIFVTNAQSSQTLLPQNQSVAANCDDVTVSTEKAVAA